MDEGFLDKYKREQSEEAFAMMEKNMAKEKLLSSMERGPITDFAMMVGGGGKFTGPVKGLLKFFPSKLDKVEAFPELQKIVTALKTMGKGEQAAAVKLLKPKIVKDRSKLDSIYNNDILNNPNASNRVASTLSKNQEAYSKFDDYLNNLISPKGMMGGGVASLMPLNYGL
tara:strand:- start:8 stop:517 length:510 start_codon:yes stop_codon:yes gene_type:complete